MESPFVNNLACGVEIKTQFSEQKFQIKKPLKYLYQLMYALHTPTIAEKISERIEMVTIFLRIKCSDLAPKYLENSTYKSILNQIWGLFIPQSA